MSRKSRLIDIQINIYIILMSIKLNYIQYKVNKYFNFKILEICIILELIKFKYFTILI